MVTEILDDFAPVTGTLTDGSFTNDQTLTINGTGEAGSTITIYDNGTVIGTANVIDGNGPSPRLHFQKIQLLTR